MNFSQSGSWEVLQDKAQGDLVPDEDLIMLNDVVGYCHLVLYKLTV